KIVALTFLFCIFAVSCEKTSSLDAGETLYRLDPNTTAKVETAAAATISVGTALSVFFPILIPFVTAAAGALTAWKAVKPKLTTAQVKEKLYYNTTSSIVHGIEIYKEFNPQGWLSLKAYLKVTPEIENVIKAIRKLPYVGGDKVIV
ncbi:MAG TPA: hypothetical protein VMY06_13460, partial [Sedimentisphaerales bacterium]|nr:hypothetical protein [Sedimentisphaerales bacterium]